MAVNKLVATRGSMRLTHGAEEVLTYMAVNKLVATRGSMRLTHGAEEPESQFSMKIQVQVNNALRLVLGVKLKDHIAVKVLQEKTNTLILQPTCDTSNK
jgi:hypothetical protein